jgi:8-oxo-dGTP pyrophosphatase MutT (NUDIX family)
MDFISAKQCLLELSSNLQLDTQVLSGGISEVVVSQAQGLRTAAILMAVMNVDGQAELLLTKRADHLTLHPGEIAFPGGKPDPGDADCLATALREAQEEVALPLSAVQYVGQLNKRVTRSRFLLTPCVGLIETAVSLVASPDEVDSIFTVPLAQLQQLDNWQFSYQGYAGSQSLSPLFMYRGHTIKGVTAKLTADFMTVCFGVTFPEYE